MIIDQKKINDTAIVPTKENNFHSNKIIDSRHEFSLLEKKMIYCVINQLDTNTSAIQRDLFEDLYFKIPVSTFGDNYGFHAVKAAIEKLMTRSIKGGDDKNEKYWAINPFPYVKIENGTVTLKLQKEAVPYFVDLKQKGYTSYQLEIALSLSSVYAQRLHELLKRWKDTRHWNNVPIERFKWLLGIDKLKAFNGANANGNIVNRILEPARKELAEKTDIEFEYKFTKDGRKYIAIDFEVFPKALIKHIETAEAKEDVTTILTEIAKANPKQQQVFLHTSLAQYQFTDGQRKQILDNNKLTLKFVEIHAQIMAGTVEIKTTTTRYMAAVLRQLGWK